VELRVFPNLSNRLGYRFQFFQPLGMRSWLRTHAGRFDVAHIHGHHHLPGTIAAGELRRAGVPYLVAPNGTAPVAGRRRLAKLVFDATLGREVLRGARGVIAVSEAERAQLEAQGVARERIFVVPNPVDLDEFAGLHASQARPEGGARRVLYLGQLLARKQVDVLVRAMAELPEPKLLEIAGNDGGCGPALRELVRELGLGSRVRFSGLLRGRERLDALAGADVVAYAGRDEVFGLVALESLLCGTPVVVANDCGCGEVVARVGGGLAVPPGDATGLARAIARILGEPARWRAAAREAAARIRACYASDVVAARCEVVYEAAMQPALLGSDGSKPWTHRLPA
jgi:glycosyltransferase involved in cell wall biosynthesis